MSQDPLFEDILKELARIHEAFPDMRFGQVMQNAVDLGRKSHNIDINQRSSKQILFSLTEFNTHHKIKRERAKNKKDNVKNRDL